MKEMSVAVTMPCGETITVPKPARKNLQVSEEAKLQATMIHLFDRLGATTSDWRKQLFREEITGFRNDGSTCVIANYLNRHMTGYRANVTSGSKVEITSRTTFHEYGFNGGHLGGHGRRLGMFIHHFDRGCYPELIYRPL